MGAKRAFVPGARRRLYERCDSVVELGLRSNVVGLCLTDDADVWELLDDKRLLSALPPGAVVVNHGTGDPEVAIALARHGEANGHVILDAPVSGGRPAAERKALTTFIGNSPDSHRPHLRVRRPSVRQPPSVGMATGQPPGPPARRLSWYTTRLCISRSTRTAG